MRQTVKVSVQVREGAGGGGSAPIVSATYAPTPPAQPTQFAFDDGMPPAPVKGGPAHHRSSGVGTDVTQPSTSSTGAQVKIKDIQSGYDKLRIKIIPPGKLQSHEFFLWYHLKYTHVQQAWTRTPLAGREDIYRRLIAGAQSWRSADHHQPNLLPSQSGHRLRRGERRAGHEGYRRAGGRRESHANPGRVPSLGDTKDNQRHTRQRRGRPERLHGSAGGR